MNIPLPAAALYRQTFDFNDGRAMQTTVFPLFDGQGKVQKLVIITEESAQIFCVGWRPGLASKPLFRPVKLDVYLGSLDDMNSCEAWQLSEWWHFDPWWLLSEEHLKNHPAAAALKSTNAVTEMEGIPSIQFTRDLAAVRWISVQTSEGTVLRDFDPTLLPPRAESAGPKSLRGAWRLRPFWER